MDRSPDFVADVQKADDGLFNIIPREDASPEEKAMLERMCAESPTDLRYVPRAPRPRGRTRISYSDFLLTAVCVAPIAIVVALAIMHT